MSDDDPFDIKALRIDPTTFSKPYVPAKIRKRREQFVVVPMWWYERLAGGRAVTKTTILIAIYLAHLHWKHHEKPFKLPNGMLKYDGVSRYSKWRALNELERLGLVTVERRPRKSPIVQVLAQP